MSRIGPGEVGADCAGAVRGAAATVIRTARSRRVIPDFMMGALYRGLLISSHGEGQRSRKAGAVFRPLESASGGGVEWPACEAGEIPRRVCLARSCGGR